MVHISVVIPAFNAEAYIGETIDSVLSQTVPGIEVIVVDDGSSDATRDRVAAHPSGVRLIQQSRGGAAKARNAGVAAATGEWIAFLDADDLWVPEKLREQLDLAARTGARFLFSDRINIGERGPLPEIQSTIQPLVDGDIFEVLLRGNFITTSSVLLQRSVFERVGGFSEEPVLPPAEDWDLWIRVAHDHHASACRLPLVQYRHHAQGASRNVARMNRARLSVIGRALDSARGRTLSAASRRAIWSETWSTNGWDAARHQQKSEALRCYWHSLRTGPARAEPYLAIARLLTGRS